MLITCLRASLPQPAAWPFTLPAVAALDAGLELTAAVTFLVGENGSGKSTLIEAIADRCGVNSEGGKAGTRYSSAGQATALGAVLDAELTAAGLRLIHGPRLRRKVFFFRAESLFNLAKGIHSSLRRAKASGLVSKSVLV
jgi:predicted ATPase